MTTPYDRLMAEAIPTGTFGGTRPTRPREDASAPTWTPQEQAAHLAALDQALDGWQWENDTSLSTKRRHLRLIRREAA